MNNIKLPPPKAPLVLSKTKTLYIEIAIAINKFPRSAKYVLGHRIEQGFLDFLEILYTAQYQKIDEKLKSLYRLQIKLDTISFLLTLAWEAKHLPHTAYKHYIEQSTEIGKMLGGWRKGVELKIETPRIVQGE